MTVPPGCGVGSILHVTVNMDAPEQPSNVRVEQPVVGNRDEEEGKEEDDDEENEAPPAPPKTCLERYCVCSCVFGAPLVFKMVYIKGKEICRAYRVVWYCPFYWVLSILVCASLILHKVTTCVIELEISILVNIVPGVANKLRKAMLVTSFTYNPNEYNDYEYKGRRRV